MIPCICIDDKNKPSIIPDEKWVKEGVKYNITYVWQMVDQVGDEVKPRGIQGVSLAELDISAYIPYNCFRMTRFAFDPKDLEALFALMKDCTDLMDADISELIEILEIEEVEI